MAHVSFCFMPQDDERSAALGRVPGGPGTYTYTHVFILIGRGYRITSVSQKIVQPLNLKKIRLQRPRYANSISILLCPEFSFGPSWIDSNDSPEPHHCLCFVVNVVFSLEISQKYRTKTTNRQ